MSPKKLPTAAETIRLSIKDMIPELSGKTTENSAKVIQVSDETTTYGGKLLTNRVALFSKQLPISNFEVCFPALFLTDGGWRIGLL